MKDEPVLPNDYPVYAGYCYVVNDKVVFSDIQGDVEDLKKDLDLKITDEVRRCDIVERYNL